MMNVKIYRIIRLVFCLSRCIYLFSVNFYTLSSCGSSPRKASGSRRQPAPFWSDFPQSTLTVRSYQTGFRQHPHSPKPL